MARTRPFLKALSWLILYVLLFYSYRLRSQSDPFTSFYQPLSPTLFDEQATLMPGYHAATNRIWLIGGAPSYGSSNEVWYYDLTIGQFVDHSSLPIHVDNMNSQSSTQIDVWIYFAHANSLRRFNMNTGLLSNWTSDLLIGAVNAPSLATDGRYIFIVGGEDENDPGDAKSTFQYKEQMVGSKVIH